MPDRFPGGAADTVGGFLEERGHHVKHFLHDGGDIRNHHDGEDETGREKTDAERRAGEELPDHGERPKAFDQPRFHVRLEERREDEETPHTVNDGRNCGEKLDRDAAGLADPDRSEFSEVNRDAERHRNRDEKSDG